LRRDVQEAIDRAWPDGLVELSFDPDESYFCEVHPKLSQAFQRIPNAQVLQEREAAGGPIWWDNSDPEEDPPDGALLRREGLYSSHLSTWRRERQAGILKGLTPLKRGPKSKRNPQEEEMQKLRRENQRLTEELRKAAIVIDVQKKVGALLGWPLPKADPEEQP
jgi:hypothetical protein